VSSKKKKNKNTSLALLLLFVSFLITPTVLTTWIDPDLDISMVFALVEEENKESKSKNILETDDKFKDPAEYLVNSIEMRFKSRHIFYNEILNQLFFPGEVAPPPELA